LVNENGFKRTYHWQRGELTVLEIDTDNWLYSSTCLNHNGSNATFQSKDKR